MPCTTTLTAGAWTPPAPSLLLGGKPPAIAPATPYDEDDPRTWPFERFMQHQRAIAARSGAHCVSAFDIAFSSTFALGADAPF